MPILQNFETVPGLPAPRGPFSQAVATSGNLLFVSGQGPYDPLSCSFVRGSIFDQTHLTLACIDRILIAAKIGRENIVSCRVYLQPLNAETFAEMNSAYSKFFGTHKPARATLGASLLGIDVEIECVALLE
jgi:2-iminobutanoate/2-iminopropanoate deaminase